MSRRSRTILAIAGSLIVAMITVFALTLAELQRSQRSDAEDRFANRAADAAALTNALFAATSAQGAADNTRDYGGEVSPAQLAAAAEESSNEFMVVAEADGTIIAASPGTPRAALREVEFRPVYLTEALESGSGLGDYTTYGDVAAEPFATAFSADDDTPRVLVQAINPDLIAAFIGGFLAESPRTEGGQVYLVDSNSTVLASTDPDSGLGEPLDRGGLDITQAEQDQGSFGDGQWFASAPVPDSTWTIVRTAPESDLFGSTSGSEQAIPWIILAAFCLAAIAAALVGVRALRAGDRVRQANAELERQASALERSNRELERSNEELEMFATIASHDLREPLRKLQMFADQLRLNEAERLSDEGGDYLRRMQDASTRMEQLIEDLLEFSRVTTRGRPFVDVDLDAVVRETMADLEAAVKDSNADVEVRPLPHVAADPMQMRQLMQNLISNGIKFSRDGVRPKVTIEGTARNGDARIVISDNGIGFDPQYAGRIFRVFERLHGRGEYQGTGIGLAICRKIVDRHGGGIVAEGEPGEGARFTITLPSARDAGSNGHDEPRGPEEGAAHGRE